MSDFVNAMARKPHEKAFWGKFSGSQAYFLRLIIPDFKGNKGPNFYAAPSGKFRLWKMDEATRQILTGDVANPFMGLVGDVNYILDFPNVIGIIPTDLNEFLTKGFPGKASAIVITIDLVYADWGSRHLSGGLEFPKISLRELESVLNGGLPAIKMQFLVKKFVAQLYRPIGYLLGVVTSLCSHIPAFVKKNVNTIIIGVIIVVLGTLTLRYLGLN